jgi:cytochrome c oxidase cbb3-type subunit III
MRSAHGLLRRFGVMPGFAERLREAEIRAVAIYVHQLGGGE